MKSTIKKIDGKEIKESWREGNDYPTVLVIGPRHYLDKVYDGLKDEYPQIKFKQKDENPSKSNTAYEILFKDENHNLGWRLLINYFLDDRLY